MPDSSNGSGHFVAHKPNSVVTRIGLDLVHRRVLVDRPSHDSWQHPHRAIYRRKRKVGRPAGNTKLAIGDIVKHVALPRMRLAPSVFGRADILAFCEISRTWILRWDQIARCHGDPVRCPGVRVARVISCAGWKRARKRIHPRT